MGFWTDKDKEQENNHPFGQANFSQNSFQQSFNTFKQCKNDPTDQNFIICKNITQQLNKDGDFETHESEEERIPASQFYNSMSNPFQGISPLFSTLESMMNSSLNGLNHGFQNIEKDFNDEKNDSFFGRLKSLFSDDKLEKDIQKYYNSFSNSLRGVQDNNESAQGENQPKTVFKKSFSSSSSSRSCKQDPEDEKYLICTTTIKRNTDGQDSTEVREERIQRQQPQQNHQMQESLTDVFKEINQPGLFSQSPLFMPFFTMNGFQNGPDYKVPNQNEQNNQNNSYSQRNENDGDRNYKYPQYEEKKKKQQGGIYDL